MIEPIVVMSPPAPQEVMAFVENPNDVQNIFLLLSTVNFDVDHQPRVILRAPDGTYRLNRAIDLVTAGWQEQAE